MGRNRHATGMPRCHREGAVLQAALGKWWQQLSRLLRWATGHTQRSMVSPQPQNSPTALNVLRSLRVGSEWHQHLPEGSRALPPGYPKHPVHGLPAADSVAGTQRGSSLGRVPAATGPSPNLLSLPTCCPHPWHHEVPARSSRHMPALRHPLRQHPCADMTWPRGTELPGQERAPTKEAKSPQTRGDFYAQPNPPSAGVRGHPSFIHYEPELRRAIGVTAWPEPQSLRDGATAPVYARRIMEMGLSPPKT